MDKLRVSSFSHTPAHRTATEQEIYSEYGLQVDWDITRSSKSQMYRLLEDSLDVVHTNADNVFWWNEDNGVDLLIVLALPSKPNQDFVVKSEITGCKDLRGKTLAVDASESGFVTPLRALLSEAGLIVTKDIDFIEVGATEERLEAMLDGRAFGAIVNSGRDLDQRQFRILDNLNRLYTHYAAPIATRREFLADHRELLVRYLKAYLCGEVRTRSSASPTAQMAVPEFAWEGLKEMMAMRNRVGLLRGPIEPRRFVDDSLYKEVVASFNC